MANVPIASGTTFGVAKGYGVRGVGIDANGNILLTPASLADVKGGYASYRPIVPNNQHESAFFALAKAAGDTTQSASANAVGQYTDEAKAAILKMLGLDVWHEAELTEADYDSDLGMILFDAGDGNKIKEIIAAGQIVNDGTQTANEQIAFGFGMTKSRNNYSCPAQTSEVASTSRRLAFQCHFRGCLAPAKIGTAYTFFPDAFFYGASTNADHGINVDVPLNTQGTQRSTNFYGNFNDSRYFKIEMPTWVPEWASIKLYYTLM